jgi:hypothetical protein
LAAGLPVAVAVVASAEEVAANPPKVEVVGMKKVLFVEEVDEEPPNAAEG